MTGRGRLGWLAEVGLHPLLIVAAVVIGFWAEASVSPHAAFRSLFVGLLVTAATLVVLSIGLRSSQRAALAMLAIFAALLSKRVILGVEGLASRMPAIERVLWLGLMAVAALLAVRIGIRLVRRSKLRLVGITKALNLFAAALLLATIVTTITSGSLGVGLHDLRQGVSLRDYQSAQLASAAHTASAPDIYVILLDGYVRADVMKSTLGFDNDGFLTALAERRFDIATASHSDYLWTHLSLLSMLHMAYIEQIPALAPAYSGDEPLLQGVRRTINENSAFSFLRDRGYTIATTGSGFEQYSLRGSDVYLDEGQLNEFEIKLLNSTFLGDVVSLLAPDFGSSQQRARIASGLQDAAEMAASPSSQPRLIFVHVPAPHQPSVFAADGSGVAVPINADFYNDSGPGRHLTPSAFARAYTAEVQHLNELVLAAVDGIVRASESPPVIVVLSDHGSASDVDWAVTQIHDASPQDLHERLSSFFAAYTPGKSGVFPDDISPVNVFRDLFDAYFGTHLGEAVPPVGGGQIEQPTLQLPGDGG